MLKTTVTSSILLEEWRTDFTIPLPQTDVSIPSQTCQRPDVSHSAPPSCFSEAPFHAEDIVSPTPPHRLKPYYFDQFMLHFFD